MTSKPSNNDEAKLRHTDFEKIHNAFLTHYASDSALGEKRYTEWLRALSLNDSKPYCKPQESFQWAKTLIAQEKEDTDAFFYKVEVLFPTESMNGNTYTREELLQATRTLTGKASNLNHDPNQNLKEIQILAAQYEDDTAECFVRILKSSPIPGMIEKKEIVNVSVEADWSHGAPGKGLVFEGLAWLTKDVLPGVPLTRIEPVEKIAEKFKNAKRSVKDAIKEQNEISCVFCEAPADVLISVCQKCLDEFSQKASSSQMQQSLLEAKTLDDLKSIVKQEIAKALETIEQKEPQNKIQTQLAETKAALSEKEGRLANAMTTLAESKKTIEQLRSQASTNGLLQKPLRQIAISEHIQILETLLPAPMVEKSTLGMQRECQIIRAAIFQAKQKLKET